jgi:hypothetical protein
MEEVVGMEAYRTEVTLAQDGTLTLEALPFHAGERVEVIVLATTRPRADGKRYPLAGTVLHYERPTDPVAEDDWEALQ